MSVRKPILLSFYGLSNGTRTVFFGKLANSPRSDLSFKGYNRFKTFTSVVALYQTHALRNKVFDLYFDYGTVRGETDGSGSFWCETEMDVRQTKLQRIMLADTGEEVLLTEDLYPNRVQLVQGNTLLISDLDDTLINSFVSSKLKQLKTLLFTTVEKREAVASAAEFIRTLSDSGVAAFYLSNSEQNLYPLLYRFLLLNGFPPGPMFLRQYVHIREWAWRKISRKKNIHKRTMLAKIVELFPEKKYILMGDNTQHDLAIYLELARQYPQNVKLIIIREVHIRNRHEQLIREAETFSGEHGIGFHYGAAMPDL